MQRELSSEHETEGLFLQTIFTIPHRLRRSFLAAARSPSGENNAPCCFLTPSGRFAPFTQGSLFIILFRYKTLRPRRYISHTRGALSRLKRWNGKAYRVNPRTLRLYRHRYRETLFPYPRQDRNLPHFKRYNYPAKLINPSHKPLQKTKSAPTEADAQKRKPR